MYLTLFIDKINLALFIQWFVIGLSFLLSLYVQPIFFPQPFDFEVSGVDPVLERLVKLSFPSSLLMEAS